jgi:hypothetical protein
LGTNKKCITDIKIINGKHASAPHGYTKLPQDLNNGAGGKYIYFCYKSETYNHDRAIKDVTIIHGNNPDINAPYGYHKIDKDLNAGAGGKYIYVCTSVNG